MRETLIDDAYITLAYAKNLALHLHWGIIPQEVSNTATSPLNVAVLGALTAVTRIGGGVHPVLALGVEWVAVAMAMAWGLARVARALDLPFATGVVGIALVLTNPVLLSAAGLEVLLIPALLVVLLAMALEGRAGWFGVVAGLAVLTRLDLIVFVAAMLPLAPAVRARWRLAIGTAAAVAAPWFVFSWVYFGSAVPDTLATKGDASAVWGSWTFGTGPVFLYQGDRPPIVFAFAPAVVGLALLAAWLVARVGVRWPPGHPLRSLDPVGGLGLGAIAYYAAYTALDPGPYHWYYVPSIAALTVFATVAAGRWLRAARERPELRRWVPAAVLAASGLLAAGSATVVARHGVPWPRPMVTTNWAYAPDYARIGKDLRARVGDATVQGPGEVGTLAYFCECAIVDRFSERGRAIEVIDDYVDDSSALVKPALELNYLLLDRDEQPRPAQYRLRFDAVPGKPGPNTWRIESGYFRGKTFTLFRQPSG